MSDATNGQCFFCGNAPATGVKAELMHEPKARQQAEVAAPACDRCAGRLKTLESISGLTLLAFGAIGGVAGWLIANYYIEDHGSIRGRGRAKGLAALVGAVVGGVIALVLNGGIKALMRSSSGMQHMDLKKYPEAVALLGQGYSWGKLPEEKKK